MSGLNGKIAVVTGGGSGIGFAIARRFVAEGAYVFITGRRQEELDKAVAAIGAGGGVEGVPGDATSAQDLDRLYQKVQASKGRLDVLVANSGVAEPVALDKITEKQFDKTFDLNARGTLFTVQKALPLMTAGGAIVLIASIASALGTPDLTTYNASKAAVRSFARTWTSELASRGIRVNALSPGPIETAMMAAAPKEFLEKVVGMIPLGRVGRPEEVAAAAVFLASEESSFIAGIELCVDGGLNQV